CHKRSELLEGSTYDVAAVRVRMTDQNGNTLPYFFGAVNVKVSGDIEPIGESPVMLRGGMGGLYIRTKGSVGRASVTLSAEGCESVTIDFEISAI
ncbi:MAG: glycoside hydrolase family 2 protein, partial [Ruminococcus sp.]|nr:glycoside hydrolase family 2 protein [Ruminococcus sp.]